MSRPYSLEIGAVSAFYRNFYSPRNAILAIVGDIDAQKAREKIIPRLEAWTTGPPHPSPFATHFHSESDTIKTDRSISQANIVIGHRGIARSNEDYYAVAVMNHILGGGGFSSRLIRQIRVERGLAYSVHSSFAVHKHPGSFRIVLQTKNTSAGRAIDVAIKEMHKIREYPVTEEELQTAKKYLIGNFPLQLVTQRSRADYFSRVSYFDLGLDYAERYPSFIDGLEQQDVQRAARRYLHPDERILVVVGDLSKISLP